MTPFAALGQMEKAAYAQQNPYASMAWQSVQPGAYGQQMPQGQQQPGGLPQVDTSRWGQLDNPWADAAVEMIPGVGSVYMGNKAVNNFKRGEWMKGIGNGVMAAASLIPGVGLIKGLFSGAKGATKGLKALNAAKGAGKGWWGGMKKSTMPYLGGMGISGVGGALHGGQPPQAMPSPYAALGGYGGGPQSFLQQGTNSLSGMDFGQ